MKFSDRLGITTATRVVQLESMDDNLRNSLWNCVKLCILDGIAKTDRYTMVGHATEFDCFTFSLWHSFCKQPIDRIPHNDAQKEEYVRNQFYTCEWFDVYNVLEYLAQMRIPAECSKPFVRMVNAVLSRESSGYRFVNGSIAPITNPEEFSEVEAAVGQYSSLTALQGVNVHLTNAISKISDKSNPDYRNSIKESISSVEVACRVITGESTLGKALPALRKKGIEIDDQLLSGFEKYYAYTNSKDGGIRHGIIAEHKDPDLADARIMLVSCSAFINYLVAKCQTDGVSIT